MKTFLIIIAIIWFIAGFIDQIIIANTKEKSIK